MNKIEFFVKALVGLYLCSCGNKQIGKTNSFSNTPNLWKTAGFHNHQLRKLISHIYGVHLFSALL